MVKLTQIGGGKAGKGTITVKDEGNVVSTNVTSINIVGTGHRVELTGPNEVTIYSPEATYVSYFNTSFGDNDCTVYNVAGSSRYISAPTSEGAPFQKGDWSAGTLHPSVNSSISYTTINQCLFDTLTSTIEAKITNADGTTVATFTTAAITGNYDITTDGIRIQVTDWASENEKYKGIITVTFDLPTLLPDSGRFNITIIHHNALNYTKTQSGLFFDANVNPATIGSVTILPNIATTKFLSGVEYYTIGTTFEILVDNIDWLNDATYPLNQIEINGTAYGLGSLLLAGSALTGWINSYDDQDDSYSKADWAITASNLFVQSSVSIAARALDWTAGSWFYSDASSLLINTRNNISTRLIERFDEESWRCYSLADFDAANAKGWLSENDLVGNEACFINGGCERNITDFTIYDPNAAEQPDYSTGMDSEVFLFREFNHDGGASANFRINITGTYTTLQMKLAKAWDGTSSGGTVWIDCLQDYNASDWNNGDPSSGGCRVASGAGYIDCTLGTNNIINTDNTLYIKVGFIAGQRITTFNVVFN
jgi:hypothetical protein